MPEGDTQADTIEKILLRRAMEKRLEGYTLETSLEIAAALNKCDPQADLTERARLFYKGFWITDGDEHNIWKLASFAQSEREAAAAKNMVPAQQLSDAGEDLVRLAAAKDAEIANWKRQHDILDAFIEERLAEIAALTDQRDRAMKLIEIARAYRGCTLDAALAAFDAETAAKTAPSLPETPET